jgi:hypothetical protein
MKIASSAIQMNSSHASQQQHEIKETLRAWVGDRRPDFEGTQRRQTPSPPPSLQFSDPVQLSDAGKNVQSSEASAIEQGLAAAENAPILRMIRAMIALLTGHDAKVFDASEITGNSSPANPPAPTQPAGFGVEYERHESYSESEQTSFQASGVVRTADGKEISFDIALSMSRSYHEESNVSIRIGDARKKQDPLVINFAGSAAQLSSQRFSFDLNSDGKAENINFATNGSGFLAFDRNGDGQINNGTELFGASSGNGFSELASLDSDRNGWIDENDAAYEKLRVWSKDAAGNDQLVTLKQADVGALNVAAVATPFDLKETNNALIGQIRSSGVFLHENGNAGTIQQVDLTV